MEMAARSTSEEGMESLVRNFDGNYQGYKDTVSEIQTLGLNYNHEIRRHEALEASCKDLRADNELLRRLHSEPLTKITNQIKHHAKCQRLKEELENISDGLLSTEAGA